MKNILLIGAGGVGRVVAFKLAQHPEIFANITFASRTKSKCDDIVKDIVAKGLRKKNEIATAQVDADNVPELVALIRACKPDLVLNVALPYQDLTIMDACLETGVHYLDTANYEHPDTAKFCYAPQWAYHERFANAGIMALLGSGFDPGMTNVYTAYAKKHYFDRMDTVDILDCNGGDHGYPFATNFNPEINIREVSAKGRYFENGDWIETEPLSVKKTFHFDGVGEKDMYLLYHEEMESLTKHFPEVKRMRFWMTFGQSYLTHLKVLENVGMTGIKPVMFEGREIVPLQFLKTLLPAGTENERQNEHRCLGGGRTERQTAAVLRVQHLRSRGMFRRDGRAGGELHDGRAGGLGSENGFERSVERQGRVQHGTVRPRPVHGGNRRLGLAVDGNLASENIVGTPT